MKKRGERGGGKGKRGGEMQNRNWNHIRKEIQSKRNTKLKLKYVADVKKNRVGDPRSALKLVCPAEC